MKVSVLGMGAFGIALSKIIKKDIKISIWTNFEDELKSVELKRENVVSLPGIKIDKKVELTTDLEKSVKNADVIFMAIPAVALREVSSMLNDYIDETSSICVVTKGIEKNTTLTLDEVIKQEIPNARVGALSGPSHAEEVSIAVPTVLVSASKDEEVRKLVQDTFMNEKMRVYTSEDIKGVELGGALKNIIAFCAGVAAGLGYGDNTFAALITRGLTEIRRLGTKLGAESNTLYGLSGLGDLIVTCLSEHSRNRRAGKLIGQGKSIEETKQEVGMTIESIDNIEVAKNLSEKLGVSMPIVDAVYDILYNGLAPEEAVRMLMTRDKKMED